MNDRVTDIIDAVSRKMGVSPENIRTGGQSRKYYFSFARRVAIYLAYVDTRLPYRKIAPNFGISHEYVKKSVWVVDEIASEDEQFEAFLLEIIAEIGCIPKKRVERDCHISRKGIEFIEGPLPVVLQLDDAIKKSGRSNRAIFSAAGLEASAWTKWKRGASPRLDTFSSVAAVLGKKLVLTDAD